MQLRRDLLLQIKSWAMLHEFDAETLRKKIRAVHSTLANLLSSVKALLSSAPSAQEVGTAKRARRHPASSSADEPVPELGGRGLSISVQRFEDTVASLVHASLQQESLAPSTSGRRAFAPWQAGSEVACLRRSIVS